jgi:peptide/nickel transport system permease protein
LALRRLRRNPLALFAVSVLSLFVLLALLGYLLTPDNTPGANRQLVAFAKRPPGSSGTVLRLRKDQQIPERNVIVRLLAGQPTPYRYKPLCGRCEVTGLQGPGDTLRFTHYNGLQDSRLFPAAVLPIDREAAFTKQQLRSAGKPYRLQNGRVTYADAQQDERRTVALAALKQRYKPVQELTFLLGTDRYGRDILSRLILGARISLGVGALAVTVSLLLGVLLGALSGYFGGWLDGAIRWLMSVIWSVPSLLLAIAIAFALGRGIQTLALAIGLATWVELARVVRGELLSLRERLYVEAARAMGFPAGRILRRHLLPNITGPIVILLCSNFATAILLEAGLSFLGLGVQPPTPSWGGMIQTGYQYIMLSGGEWLAIFPGACIILIIAALNLFAIALRDALDPKALH